MVRFVWTCTEEGFDAFDDNVAVTRCIKHQCSSSDEIL